MTVAHFQGGLFASTAPSISQGVNVRGAMGAGIAADFRSRYPHMYETYRVICLAGQLQPGETFTYRAIDGQVIHNIASQQELGPDAKLEWLQSGLVAAIENCDEFGIPRHIAMPRIGCGIGGLDWEDVLPLVTTVADQHQAHIEVWSL